MPALKILHVEDDPIDACLVREALAKDTKTEPCELTQVSTLRDAAAALSARSFDAVLLDLNLPERSGFENIRHFSRDNPDMPIVVLTGQHWNDGVAAAVHCGAQEYLHKGTSDGRVIRHIIHSSIHRKAVERQLYQQANYDAVTKLFNRRHFYELLEQRLASADRWKIRETVLFIDLDDFKAINDRHGHDTGDAVLFQVGQRLTRTLRTTDIAARYAGDEFVVLLDDHQESDFSAICAIAAKLLEAICEPITHKHTTIVPGASIGVAHYPDHGGCLESLMQSADRAMYRAKETGGGRFRFASRREPETPGIQP